MITIALGVAFGIVLAVLILRYWPVLIAGSALIIVIGIVLAVLAVGCYYAWGHRTIVGNVLLFSFIALPFVLFGWKGLEVFCKKYPKVPNFFKRHDYIARWCMGIFCVVMFIVVMLIYGYSTS